MEEEQLVEQMKQGNKEAFDKLYEQYKDIAMRTTYLIVHNQTDSEDIVQESFIKCYQNIGSLKCNEKFRGWFFQLLTRTAWAYAKRKSREIPQEDMTTYMGCDTGLLPSDTALNNEAAAYMMQCINTLPIKQRTVVVLYYYNAFSTKEIASILGCFEGTVKSRLFVARKALKETLLSHHQSKEDVYDEAVGIR